MTSNDPEQLSRAGFLKQLRQRLSLYKRDVMFSQTATLDRIWWAETFESSEQTYQKLAKLLSKCDAREVGCWELNTNSPARVQYRDRRLYAYQLVYWAGKTLLPAHGDVVRHKCHNRLCINPNHLIHGTQRDNIDDELTKLLSHPHLL